MSTLESNIHRVFDSLLPKIIARRQKSHQPVILGITGLQGSGKSTWAAKIVQLLQSSHLNTVTISLDDLYKTHDGLVAQRNQHPGNALYRTRGQPGTHDEQLATQFFEHIRANELPVAIPTFDKSKFHGEGDRAPESEWPVITTKPDVLVFEGWCVGFQPLATGEVTQRHAQAQEEPGSTLPRHRLEQLLQVNDCLGKYCAAFMGPEHFDFLIHIDTHDLQNVYTWRLEQEHKLLASRGVGMSDKEVAAFIDGYMPGYELYLGKLRQGFFNEGGKQMRVLLDKERRVESVKVI
ncbi:P-loop containing nucleoside triphosphate hydrolase protein [Lophiostoma macrostomum CBS 122681]|uniref:P-loop containing nucleoside triphosphate hydrolase protein n=1 Tax=Lophiostoma macrostomum CBS 122681 TaxID=1314788 RepID=A0A6A6SLQ1_9PLEO|nr:P-loop containing nucleoside triphosphate hydrolase protein [Lophiostoma macrostomum CBS 122681]